MFRTRRQSLDAEDDEYEYSNVLIDGVIRRVPAERPLKSVVSLRPAYDEYLLGGRPEDHRLRAAGRAEGDDTKLPFGPMMNGEGQFVIAEPEKKSWDKFTPKQQSLADLQKLATLALPSGSSGPGTGLRGKSITRKPRITKSDRQRMEQERRDRQSNGRLASNLSDEYWGSDKESTDTDIAQHHSPQIGAFLGGLSRGPVDLGQASRAFKQIDSQPWKSSRTQTSISSTISRDNTCGESARQADLLAEFGRKRGFCDLTTNLVKESALSGLNETQKKSRSRKVELHKDTGFELLRAARAVFPEPSLGKEAGQVLLNVRVPYSQGNLGDVAENLMGIFKKATIGDETLSTIGLRSSKDDDEDSTDSY